MNYLACFLLLGVLSVSAEVYSQEGMISLKMKDVSLVEVFNEITRKTGYDFLYNCDVVQHKGNVSVNAKTVQLKTLLRDLLSSKDLEYEFKDDVIIVRNRTDEFVQVIPQSVKKRTVVGTVKDSKGEPIPGASIIVKGTQTGVATDIDGKFEIRVDDVAGVIFQISFVGMKNKEVKLGTSNVLNVVLESDTKALEEVIVTGYQTISRERATGAFDIVSVAQITKPTSDIATRLIGTTAGVQNRLDSNGKLVFEIRAQTSLNTDNARPLVVVDGFAVEDEFSSINPNDVESITILKDAAAASIWGARSANGVIVVTTKKGKQETTKGARVNVSAFAKISRKLDLDTYRPFASSADVVDYEQRGFSTNFFGGPWSPIDDSYTNAQSGYSQAVVAMNEHRLGFISESDMNKVLEKLKMQDNKSQIKKYLLQLPVTQQYNVNISGVTDRMTNMLSLMYENEKNNFKENNTDRFLVNYRTNVGIFSK